jgi:methyltransferase (TIGR00027 family)
MDKDGRFAEVNVVTADDDVKSLGGLDAEAAFPTAQLTSAMRALDASTTKLIGSNIGGAPDLAASVFQVETGPAFLVDYAEASGFSTAIAARGLTDRTMYFDQKWVEALNNGCTQFVILAAGLDARAWRIPGMDSSIHVYEVDVTRAMSYKEGKVSQVSEICGPPSCTRVPVEADLSETTWGETLVSSGFNTSLPSFFLVEGLLMYLPVQAPRQLLTTAASLMCAGSVLCGDGMVNLLASVGEKVKECLHKYGTCWVHEFKTRNELQQSLTDLGPSQCIDGQRS